MKYYVVETYLGTTLIKTKSKWENAGQAGKELKFPVMWVRPISATTYFALWLKKRILKKDF